MFHGSPFSLRETERGKNNSKIYLVERETESDVRKKIVVSRKKTKEKKDTVRFARNKANTYKSYAGHK